MISTKFQKWKLFNNLSVNFSIFCHSPITPTINHHLLLDVISHHPSTTTPSIHHSIHPPLHSSTTTPFIHPSIHPPLLHSSTPPSIHHYFIHPPLHPSTTTPSIHHYSIHPPPLHLHHHSSSTIIIQPKIIYTHFSSPITFYYHVFFHPLMLPTQTVIHTTFQKDSLFTPSLKSFSPLKILTFNLFHLLFFLPH